MTKTDMLIENSSDWYAVTMLNGALELRHATTLTAILDCDIAPEDCGILQIEQCWNGQDLSIEL
jgi:hypothetical protein